MILMLVYLFMVPISQEADLVNIMEADIFMLKDALNDIGLFIFNILLTLGYRVASD